MKGGSVIIDVVRKIIRKILTESVEYDHFDPSFKNHDEKDHMLAGNIPEDVKEGHFAVYAVDKGAELRRFVIELRYLAHPGFLRLLGQAEEEFGFGQTGVLSLPCAYSDLQSVIGIKEES